MDGRRPDRDPSPTYGCGGVVEMRSRGAALAVAVLCLLGACASAAAAEAPPTFTPYPVFESGIDTLLSAAFSPDGHHIALVCACSPPLRVYSVDGGGHFTPVAERIFGDLPSVDVVEFSPDGRFIATTDGSSVYMFAVSPAATLTSIPPVSGGPGIRSIAFSPDGHLLATANLSDDTVSTFSVGEEGGLTPIGSFATGHWPAKVAFSPDGHLVAVTNGDGESVSMFTVAADGKLTPAGTVAAGEVPEALAFSPDGKLLVVADGWGSVPLREFTVAADGGLTPVPGPIAGARTEALAFSPDGHMLAASNLTTVTVYDVGAGGQLTPIGEPLPTGAEWASWVGFDPLGGTLLATSTNQTSSQMGTISSFAYPIAPPTATIASPADGLTFAVGEPVPTSFSCADSELGTGIASCEDSGGAAIGTGTLDTSKPGTFTYTVTARSRDGESGSSSLTYTVAGPQQSTSGSTPPPPAHPGAHTHTHATGPAAARISKIRLSGATLTWCGHCAYPRTKLGFRLSAVAEVRVLLQRRLHGRFRQVAVTTLDGRAGANSFPVGRRWHGRLLPHDATRLLVQLRANGAWKTERSLKLTVRQRGTAPRLIGTSAPRPRSAEARRPDKPA